MKWSLDAIASSLQLEFEEGYDTDDMSEKLKLVFTTIHKEGI